MTDASTNGLASADRPVAPPRSGWPPGLLRSLAALFLFGVSFGLVEAAVVVYLRGLYEPVHQRVYPGRQAGDLLPVLTLEHLRAEGPQPMRWLAVELAREAATMLMLAAAGLAVARNGREWLAAFLIAFGTWDVLYYVFLKVLIDWPASLLTWDLLFLLPVPWVGPVLPPVLVALAMVAAGVLTLRREFGGQPMRLGAAHWMAVFAGGAVIIIAFCWDYPNILAGGLPNPFPWPLFFLGLGIGLAGFGHAFWAGRVLEPGRPPEPIGQREVARRSGLAPLSPPGERGGG